MTNGTTVLIRYDPDDQRVWIVSPTNLAPSASIVELRKQMRYTQLDLAERAGISRNYLRQIEGGTAKNLSLVIARRIAKALYCTVDDIFPLDDGTS